KPLASRDLALRIRLFLDGTRRQAEQMLGRLNAGKGLDYEWQNTLHGFYQELLPEPIRGELRQARTLLVVPHHILHYFPFAALVTQPDREPRGAMEMVKPQFLIDEPYNISYAPSLMSWDQLRQRSDRPVSQASIIAIPDLPGTPPPLEGVKIDLKNLTETFGNQVATI